MEGDAIGDTLVSGTETEHLRLVGVEPEYATDRTLAECVGCAGLVSLDEQVVGQRYACTLGGEDCVTIAGRKLVPSELGTCLDHSVRCNAVHRGGAAAADRLGSVDQCFGQVAVHLLDDGFHGGNEQLVLEVFDLKSHLLVGDRERNVGDLRELHGGAVLVCVLDGYTRRTVELLGRERRRLADGDSITLLSGEVWVEVAPDKIAEHGGVVERCKAAPCDNARCDEVVSHWRTTPFFLGVCVSAVPEGTTWYA